VKNAHLGFINNDNLGDSFVAIRGEADDVNGAFIRLRLFHGPVEFLSVESHHLPVRSGRVGGVFFESLSGLAECRSLSRATSGEGVFASYFKPVEVREAAKEKIGHEIAHDTKHSDREAN